MVCRYYRYFACNQGFAAYFQPAVTIYQTVRAYENIVSESDPTAVRVYVTIFTDTDPVAEFNVDSFFSRCMDAYIAEEHAISSQGNMFGVMESHIRVEPTGPDRETQDRKETGAANVCQQ